MKKTLIEELEELSARLAVCVREVAEMAARRADEQRRREETWKLIGCRRLKIVRKKV